MATVDKRGVTPAANDMNALAKAMGGLSLGSNAQKSSGGYKLVLNEAYVKQTKAEQERQERLAQLQKLAAAQQKEASLKASAPTTVSLKAVGLQSSSSTVSPPNFSCSAGSVSTTPVISRPAVPQRPPVPPRPDTATKVATVAFSKTASGEVSKQSEATLKASQQQQQAARTTVSPTVASAGGSVLKTLPRLAATAAPQAQQQVSPSALFKVKILQHFQNAKTLKFAMIVGIVRKSISDVRTKGESLSLNELSATGNFNSNINSHLDSLLKLPQTKEIDQIKLGDLETAVASGQGDQFVARFRPVVSTPVRVQTQVQTQAVQQQAAQAQQQRAATVSAAASAVSARKPDISTMTDAERESAADAQNKWICYPFVIVSKTDSTEKYELFHNEDYQVVKCEKRAFVMFKELKNSDLSNMSHIPINENTIFCTYKHMIQG